MTGQSDCNRSSSLVFVRVWVRPSAGMKGRSRHNSRRQCCATLELSESSSGNVDFEILLVSFHLRTVTAIGAWLVAACFACTLQAAPEAATLQAKYSEL